MKCVVHPYKRLVLGGTFVLVTLVMPLTQANTESEVDAALMRLLKMESSSLPQVNAQGNSRLNKNAPGEAAKGHYRIRAGDTLDGIIMRFYGDSSLQKKILRDAFLKANPQSFRRNNANWMLAGTVIRLPDRDAVYNVVFKDDAVSLRNAADKSDLVKFPR